MRPLLPCNLSPNKGLRTHPRQAQGSELVGDKRFDSLNLRQVWFLTVVEPDQDTFSELGVSRRCEGGVRPDGVLLEITLDEDLIL